MYPDLSYLFHAILGTEPDNWLSLAELGNFERSQLKDAFGVVASLQSVLGQRYRH